MRVLRPVDGEFAALSGAVFVEDLFVLDAELVDELRALDVEAAVLGYFEDFTLTPPGDGLETVGRFSDAEGCAGDCVEGDARFEAFFDFDEQVEGWDDGGEVEDGVFLEDFVIEVDEVVADDHVCAAELVDEGVHLFFAVDAVSAGGGGVGDGDGDAHVAFFVPAPDVLG